MDEQEFRIFAQGLNIPQETRTGIRDALIRYGVIGEAARNIPFNNEMIVRMMTNAYFNHLTDADRVALDALTAEDEDEEEENHGQAVAPAQA